MYLQYVAEDTLTDRQTNNKIRQTHQRTSVFSKDIYVYLYFQSHINKMNPVFCSFEGNACEVETIFDDQILSVLDQVNIN